MTDPENSAAKPAQPNPQTAGRRFEELPPAAQRALKEAEERRRAAEAAERPKEINGRSGPEPVRYGDWEVKGIASDF
ncbi:MAG: DUF1674 domain-containing protein [Ancalomicrobiaceae bacterium]|nr:DUF1674 domain-containing protein [Ancalomicrobiaceae bacterium]